MAVPSAASALSAPANLPITEPAVNAADSVPMSGQVTPTGAQTSHDHASHDHSGNAAPADGNAPKPATVITSPEIVAPYICSAPIVQADKAGAQAACGVEAAKALADSTRTFCKDVSLEASKVDEFIKCFKDNVAKWSGKNAEGISNHLFWRHDVRVRSDSPRVPELGIKIKDVATAYKSHMFETVIREIGAYAFQIDEKAVNVEELLNLAGVEIKKEEGKYQLKEVKVAANYSKMSLDFATYANDFAGELLLIKDALDARMAGAETALEAEKAKAVDAAKPAVQAKIKTVKDARERLSKITREVLVKRFDEKTLAIEIAGNLRPSLEGWTKAVVRKGGLNAAKLRATECKVGGKDSKIENSFLFNTKAEIASVAEVIDTTQAFINNIKTQLNLPDETGEKSPFTGFLETGHTNSEGAVGSAQAGKARYSHEINKDHTVSAQVVGLMSRGAGPLLRSEVPWYNNDAMDESRKFRLFSLKVDGAHKLTEDLKFEWEAGAIDVRNHNANIAADRDYMRGVDLTNPDSRAVGLGGTLAVKANDNVTLSVKAQGGKTYNPDLADVKNSRYSDNGIASGSAKLAYTKTDEEKAALKGKAHLESAQVEVGYGTGFDEIEDKYNLSATAAAKWNLTKGLYFATEAYAQSSHLGPRFGAYALIGRSFEKLLFDDDTLNLTLRTGGNVGQREFGVGGDAATATDSVVVVYGEDGPIDKTVEYAHNAWDALVKVDYSKKISNITAKLSLWGSLGDAGAGSLVNTNSAGGVGVGVEW